MARKPPSLSFALDKALRSADLDAQDAAAVALAKHYASLIDSDREALARVGHLVLPVLRELGLTPAARQAVVPRGATAGGVPSKLDEIRARRARLGRPEVVDAASS